MSPAAIVIGLIIIFTAFKFDTAPEGTHNLGLLQQQMMVLQCGIGLVVVGAILSLRNGIGLPVPNQTGQAVTDPDPEYTTEAEEKMMARTRNAWIAVGAVAVIGFVYLVWSSRL